MLAIDRVSRTYPNGVEALSAASLAITSGEAVAIVGGSGCGKSTLLRLVAGLDRPTRGTVTVAGEPVVAPRPEVGVVFQEPRLLPWLTVLDNAAFFVAGGTRAERREAAMAELRAVGLADKIGAWPRELSGGQAQRVALARAFAAAPRLLLMDEPFSALDPRLRHDLTDQLADLWTSRAPDARPTLLLVTHDVEEAIGLADRVVIMSPGPGRLFEEVPIGLPRPRDRSSLAFADLRRRLLAGIDRSLGRAAPIPAPEGAANWW